MATARQSAMLDGAGERSSHFESAQEANDIYNLYGRDSWASDSQAGVSFSPNYGARPLPDMADRDGSEEQLEELDLGGGRAYADEEDEVYATPRPFPDAFDYVSVPNAQQRRSPAPAPTPGINGAGQVSAGGIGGAQEGHWDYGEYARPSTAQDFTRQDDEWSVGGHSVDVPHAPAAPAAGGVGEAVTRDYGYAQPHPVPRAPPHQLAQTWTATSPQEPQAAPGGYTYREKTASSTSTPSPPPHTPELAVHTAPTSPMDESSRPASGSAIPPHLRSEQPPKTPPQRLTPPDSNTTSPVHPRVARISNASRNGLGTEPSSAGSSIAGMSNASLVSSQYPGEDTDAYHVRSTYARLDVEGVYGDGWDEGIERTRGGISPGTRVTMSWPAEDGVMTDQELKFLKSLDRYGFVDSAAESRSEHRLVRVPAAPFSKHPKVQAGKVHDHSKPPPAAKGPPPSPPSVPAGGPNRADVARAKKKETERVGKWMKMMSVAERDEGRNAVQWRWSTTEGAKHTTRIWKGIPDRWRMAAWWTLAESAAERERKKGGRVVHHDSLESDYIVRKDLPSSNDVQIDLDVPRTISGHFLFRTRFGHGQRALFHVLHAFSQSCGTCGYCQGMGSVAATLLCYFEPERTYSLLVRLHDLYDMHGMFAPGFPGLLEVFYVQERLIECIMPDVYASFKRHMISSSAWGAKIYITLFVNVVPFNVQLRLWDAMFLDGIDVMVVTVVALLWAFRKELAHPAADFESILSLLSSYYVPEDEDAMLEWMRRLLWQPGVRELMAHWRRDWQARVAQGTDGEALL